MPSLHLNDLELGVRLGWPAAERSAPQSVRVNLEIHFAETPIACRTDRLDGTVDYTGLAVAMREAAGRKEYRLLEHLAFELMAALGALVPAGARLVLRITKFPAIEGLTGGAAFTLEGPGS